MAKTRLAQSDSAAQGGVGFLFLDVRLGFFLIKVSLVLFVMVSWRSLMWSLGSLWSWS